MHTVSEAAATLGIGHSTVTLWCRKLGYERIGRDWLLTDEQVLEIGERAQDGPGRPRKA